MANKAKVRLKPDCKKGNPCGFTCINKGDECHLTAEQEALLDKLVNDVADSKKSNAELKKEIISKVTNPKVDQQTMRRAVAQIGNRLAPDQVRQILANKVTVDGKTMTVEELGKSGLGKGVYRLDEMKLRQVTDAEVDTMWAALGTAQIDLLFPENAGAPNRDNGGQSYKETDWGIVPTPLKATKDEKDAHKAKYGASNLAARELMRKSMLKAMMEQSTDDGRIIDPWTGAELRFPADLDHILPLTKGGGHGGNVSQLNTQVNSENWVWIDPNINRAYKNEDDLETTIARLQRHNTSDKDYNDYLDAKVKEYQTAKVGALASRDTVTKQIQAYINGDMTGNEFAQLYGSDVIQTLNKKKATEIVKALKNQNFPEDTWLIPNTQLNLPNGDQQKAVGLLMNSLLEDQDAAAAKIRVAETYKRIVEQGLTPPVYKIPSNKAVQGIVQRPVDELSAKQQHRILDKFMAVYNDPSTDSSLPDDIRSLWSEGLKTPIPRSQLSASPWAWSRGGKEFPDLSQMPPAKRNKLYKYLQDSLIP